jgi:hypothetical protein
MSSGSLFFFMLYAPLTYHQRLNRYAFYQCLLVQLLEKHRFLLGYLDIQPATLSRVAANRDRETRWHDLK